MTMTTTTTTTTTTTATTNNGTEMGDANDNNNNTVVFDCLPYVESIHEDYEEYALALIEDEMKAIEPLPLKKVPPIRFRTELMRVEYSNVKMIEQHQHRTSENDPNNNVEGVMEDGTLLVATIQREGNLNHTISFHPSKIARPTTLDEWSSHAIPEIKKRFEAERIRAIVLDAEKEDGVDSWKVHNSALDDLKSLWIRLLKDRSDAVEEINFQRQQRQQEYFGPELDRLNQQYQEALYRRNQVEHAIEALKRSYDFHQHRKDVVDDNNRKRKAS
jgi:hypothetical protein